MSDNKAIETLYEDLMGGPVFYAALFDGKLYIIEASDFMEAEKEGGCVLNLDEIISPGFPQLVILYRFNCNFQGYLHHHINRTC